MEVHPLDETFRLHADEREARAIERELLLLHAALVDGADAILDARELEPALVLMHGPRKDRFALRRRDTGGERTFHFAEGPYTDLAVLGDRRLLLGGAGVDLRLQQPAEENGLQERRTGAEQRIVSILEDEELRGDRREVRRQRDPWQTRCF